MQESHTAQAAALREDFGYLEGMRWHDGKVWFSDVARGNVHTMSPDGQDLTVVAKGLPAPSGLGFRSDGKVLVVCLGDATLRAINPEDGTHEVVADLSEVAVGPNDMWVDANDRAYISQVGYELSELAGEGVPSRLITVDADGTVSTSAEGVMCPNGIQLTADGKTLVVAESFVCRLSAFDVNEDGTLSNQRVIKQFDDKQDVLDGLVLDNEGAVWVAQPFRGEVKRIAMDGEITDIVKTQSEGWFAVSPTLSEDGATLYLAAAETTIENLLGGIARVESVEVGAPGVK